MLNWSNAFSQAGTAAAAVGLEGVKASLEQDRIKLADQLAGARELARDNRQKEAQIETEERAITNAPRMQDAQRPGLLALAEGQSGIRINEARQTAIIQTEREVEAFRTLAPLKRQEAIDTEVAKVKALATPDMLKAARAIAQAGHIVDPQYSLMPNADGTVDAVNLRNPKDTVKLKDADGKPLVRKDGEEMKAAVSVINLANTNLKIAEAAYKVDAASLEPGVKEKAVVNWEAAQREAKQISAPAFAVLYGKAKIPGVTSESTPEGRPTPGPVNIRKLKANPGKAAEFDATFGEGAAARILGGKSTPATPAEPTTKLPVGAPDPTDDAQAQRRAARAAAAAKEAEDARDRRRLAREADAKVAEGFSRLTR